MPDETAQQARQTIDEAAEAAKQTITGAVEQARTIVAAGEAEAKRLVDEAAKAAKQTLGEGAAGARTTVSKAAAGALTTVDEAAEVAKDVVSAGVKGAKETVGHDAALARQTVQEAAEAARSKVTQEAKRTRALDVEQQQVLSDAASELAVSVQNLHESVAQASAVRDELVLLETGRKFNRRLAVIAIIGLVLDLLLSVAFAFLFVRQNHNVSVINALTQQLNTSQNVTRVQVLCPLYAYLTSQEPAALAAAKKQGPAAVAAVNQQIKIISTAYNALDCAHYLTGH